MSRKSAEKAIEKYVYDLMPEEVQEARQRALHDLYYGPTVSFGEGDEDEDEDDMSWGTNSKIVNDWWDDNMGDDFVVDDGDNVSTKYEFDKFLESVAKERYKEAYDEYVAEHTEEADENEDIDLDRDAEAYAEREAQYAADGSNMDAMLFESRDVRDLILGSEWPR